MPPDGNTGARTADDAPATSTANEVTETALDHTSTGGRVQLFAAGVDDPRARRPVDLLRAVGYVALLLLACVLSAVGRDLDRQFSELLVAFPGFLQFLWRIGFWGAVTWVLILMVITAVRHRIRLTGEAILASLIAIGGAACVAAIVTRDAGEVFRRLVDADAPPVFPPAALAVTSAALATFAPFLTLPFRRFGRVLILAQLVGSLFLGASLASGAVASVAIGLLAGTALHLVFGSPGGLPTVGRVRAALAELNLDVSDLKPLSIGREGSAVLVGSDAAGAIQVKVYGRDAWDGEFLASLWRRLWYRGGHRTARLGRAEYVEHEGFVSFLAQQAGAHLPAVVSAGLADNGDALIITRPRGAPLSDAEPSLTASEVGSLWEQLAILHAARIAHRSLDVDRVVTFADGTAGFSDLSSASVHCNSEDKLRDRAQLLALGWVATDEDTAFDQARSALGANGLIEVLPYFQEAAMAPGVRSLLRHRHIELDPAHKRLADRLGASETELVKLQRVTWRSLLNLALLAVAAYTLIGMLADIDFGSFTRALRDADWWWLAAALVIGQLPRFANAISAMGSTSQALPFGPTTLLQFATCYVNLAVPSSAGKVAITTRFYQRFGIPPAAAVSAGLIDSVSELIVQAALFLCVFFISDIDLGLSFSQDQLSGLATTALIVVGVLLAAIGIGVAVPSLRARMLRTLQDAREALRVLRSPRKLAQLYGGNLLAQVLFAITLGACVHAFGMDVPLTSLILINTVVSLFAGLLPVPGGVGVSEAGLSLGLTRAGIPADMAFAIALSYRFAVFYLPPLWGYLSFKWLTQRRYL